MLIVVSPQVSAIPRSSRPNSPPHAVAMTPSVFVLVPSTHLNCSLQRVVLFPPRLCLRWLLSVWESCACDRVLSMLAFTRIVFPPRAVGCVLSSGLESLFSRFVSWNTFCTFSHVENLLSFQQDCGISS